MAYRLRRNESIQKNVRRIALDEIDNAIGEIMDEGLDRHEAVHQVRKRCKKLRGLIRLVRPVFADYQIENAFFRDAARELSYVRDAQTIVDSLDQLIDYFGKHFNSQAFAASREALADRCTQMTQDHVGLEDRLNGFLHKIQQARQRVIGWKITDDGFSTVEGGLKRSYRRCRQAMRVAQADPTTEHLHEWRKLVKYHGYHLRLLRRIWPPMMKVHRRAADELGEILGDDHDLAVLRATLLAEPDRYGGSAELQLLIGLIDQRRAQLQASAWPRGARLLAEGPTQFVARLRKYYRIWCADRPTQTPLKNVGSAS